MNISVQVLGCDFREHQVVDLFFDDKSLTIMNINADLRDIAIIDLSSILSNQLYNQRYLWRLCSSYRRQSNIFQS